MHKFTYLLVMSCLMSACQPKPAVYTGYKSRELTFGSGGGFSGQTTTYLLHEDGVVFRRSKPDQTPEYQRRISKKEAKRFFETYDALKISELNIREPGNMSYFLGMNQGGEHKSIIWSQPAQIPAGVKDLYDQLSTTTNQP
jgi:hypothetical protein